VACNGRQIKKVRFVHPATDNKKGAMIVKRTLRIESSPAVVDLLGGPRPATIGGLK
jgi:hypothetical protein